MDSQGPPAGRQEPGCGFFSVRHPGQNKRVTAMPGQCPQGRGVSPVTVGDRVPGQGSTLGFAPSVLITQLGAGH